MGLSLARISACVLAVVLAIAGAGCRQPACVPRGRAFEVSLPEWFTQPGRVGAEEVPVDIGMRLPDEMASLQKRYPDLPDWVVYGVVRSLGAREFLITGVLRTFTLTDGGHEARVVLDTIRYNVAEDRVDEVLREVAKGYAEQGDDRARVGYLGRFLRYRFASYALFSMAGAGDAMAAADNLLMRSGMSSDPMESFTRTTAGFEPLGWRETPTDFRLTLAGDFRYGDAIGSFRRVEEDAIQEMARSVLVSMSHVQRKFDDGTDARRTVEEDVLREQLVLRMTGVRVLRRMVDLKEGACVVTVAVPKAGLARQ